MTGGSPALAELRPLLTEVGDAKRVRVADAPGSLAEQAFARTWGRLVAGRGSAAILTSSRASGSAASSSGPR